MYPDKEDWSTEDFSAICLRVMGFPTLARVLSTATWGFRSSLLGVLPFAEGLVDFGVFGVATVAVVLDITGAPNRVSSWPVERLPFSPPTARRSREKGGTLGAS